MSDSDTQEDTRTVEVRRTLVYRFEIPNHRPTAEIREDATDRAMLSSTAEAKDEYFDATIIRPNSSDDS